MLKLALTSVCPLVPYAARGVCADGVLFASPRRLLEAGITERITPLKGMLMGSRSSQGARRWVCSSLSQLQQATQFEMARQDSQYQA